MDNKKRSTIIIAALSTIIVILLGALAWSFTSNNSRSQVSSTSASNITTSTVSSTESTTHAPSITLLSEVKSDDRSSHYDYDPVSKTLQVDSILDYFLEDNAINDATNVYLGITSETSYSDYDDYFPFLAPFNPRILNGTIKRIVEDGEAGQYITTFNVENRRLMGFTVAHDGAEEFNYEYAYSDDMIYYKNGIEVTDFQPLPYVQEEFYSDRIEKDSNGNITLLEFDTLAGKRTMQISYNDKGRISTVELTDDFNHVVTLYTYAEY